jgi:hypothetical protein
LLHDAFDDPEDKCSEEHKYGYLIDAVHHTQVEITLFCGVRLLENPDKIIPNFSYLKELL